MKYIKFTLSSLILGLFIYFSFFIEFRYWIDTDVYDYKNLFHHVTNITSESMMVVSLVTYVLKVCVMILNMMYYGLFALVAILPVIQLISVIRNRECKLNKIITRLTCIVIFVYTIVPIVFLVYGSYTLFMWIYIFILMLSILLYLTTTKRILVVNKKIWIVALSIGGILFITGAIIATRYDASQRDEYYEPLISGVANDLIIIEVDGKYGAIRTNGEVVLEAIYQHIENPDSILVKPKGYLTTYLNNKRGLIDYNGNIILENEYDVLQTEESGIIVMKLGQYAILDYEGNYLLEPLPLNVKILEVFERYVIIVENEQLKIIDLDGNTIVDQLPQDTSIDYIQEDIAYTYRLKSGSDYEKGHFGFIHLKEQINVNPTYENKFHFSEGLAAVKLNNLYGYIDKKGEVIIDFQYGDAKPFTEGLAAVTLNGVAGYINQEGMVEIPFQFKETFPFFNGVARVIRLNQDCPELCIKEFINQDGNKLEMIHSSEFYDENIVYNYDRDKLWLQYEGSYHLNELPYIYYVTENGNVYYKLENELYGYLVTTHETKELYGLKDVNNKTLLENEYRAIDIVSENLFCGEVFDNKWDCFDQNGNKILSNTSYYVFRLKHELIYFKTNAEIMIYDLSGENVITFKNLLTPFHSIDSENLLIYSTKNQIISYNTKTKEEQILFEIKE